MWVNSVTSLLVTRFFWKGWGSSYISSLFKKAKVKHALSQSSAFLWSRKKVGTKSTHYHLKVSLKPTQVTKARLALNSSAEFAKDQSTQLFISVFCRNFYKRPICSSASSWKIDPPLTCISPQHLTKYPVCRSSSTNVCWIEVFQFKTCSKFS